MFPFDNRFRIKFKITMIKLCGLIFLENLNDFDYRWTVVSRFSHRLHILSEGFVVVPGREIVSDDVNFVFLSEKRKILEIEGK